MRQGTNSWCPSRSLHVISPDATRNNESRISVATSSRVATPAAMRPALISILSRIRWKVPELLAIFSTGSWEPDGATAAGGEGDQVHAACRQARQAGRIVAGCIHEDEPGAVHAPAYPATSLSGEAPDLAVAPSAFSRIVVRPPSLLPGEGLSLKLPPKRARYSLY